MPSLKIWIGCCAYTVCTLDPFCLASHHFFFFFIVTEASSSPHDNNKKVVLSTLADVHESMHRRVHQRVVHRSARKSLSELLSTCRSRRYSPSWLLRRCMAMAISILLNLSRRNLSSLRYSNGMNTYQCGAMSLLTVLWRTSPNHQEPTHPSMDMMLRGYKRTVDHP